MSMSPLSYVSYNVTPTCAPYYNGTDATALGFVIPSVAELEPYAYSFLVVTPSQGPTQNGSGFVSLFGNNSVTSVSSGCYLAAPVYPPNNASTFGDSSPAEFTALKQLNAPYTIINVNEQLAFDDQSVSPNISITPNITTPFMPKPLPNAASYGSKVVNSTCAAHYGGTNLSTPAFVLPTTYNSGLSLDGDIFFNIFTITQGANENATGFHDIFTSTADGDGSIEEWLDGCYLRTIVAAPDFPGVDWSRVETHLKELNAPYYLQNAKLQITGGAGGRMGASPILALCAAVFAVSVSLLAL